MQETSNKKDVLCSNMAWQRPEHPKVLYPVIIVDCNISPYLTCEEDVARRIDLKSIDAISTTGPSLKGPAQLLNLEQSGQDYVWTMDMSKLMRTGYMCHRNPRLLVQQTGPQVITTLPFGSIFYHRYPSISIRKRNTVLFPRRCFFSPCNNERFDNKGRPAASFGSVLKHENLILHGTDRPMHGWYGTGEVFLNGPTR